MIAIVIMIGPSFHRHHDIDFEVIEAPKVAAQPIQVAQRKIQPRKAFKHEVFGASRRSLDSMAGEEVKAGNTVAKTPDQEKLRPEDPDSLPIPTEDYLISKMPELKAETRIPYPPGPKRKGIQGAVVMDLLIDMIGRVREAILVDGPDSDLNQAALAAVRNFQFTPAYVQEKPVAVRIRYAYRFVLEL